MASGCGHSFALGAHVRKSKLVRPEYGERFRCIGAECEDTCCRGWYVAVDEESYNRYQYLPQGPLRAEIVAAIELTPEASEKSGAKAHAAIKMRATGDCPLLNEERLCRIQAELGHDFLCGTCRGYPRTRYRIDKMDEYSLSLSCPEAARLVLLSDRLLSSPDEPGYEITWNDTTRSFAPVRKFFWPIREFTVRLITNRRYPLWQRLFLLGTFSRRLDAIAHDERKRTVPEFLLDFGEAVDSGTLSAVIESIRPDPATQLEIVLQLVELRGGPCASPRLLECLTAFASGIGCRPGATRADQIDRYEAAYRENYTPFFERHPHILENYLLNQMFRQLFPFDTVLFHPAATPDCAASFASLATRFALIKGMLIGVAGFYGERISEAHVVQVVQTVSRHFEHSPQFLEHAATLLRVRSMNTAKGLTMLIRN